MENKQKFKTPYNRSKTPGIHTPGGSRAAQSFKDDCDINVIVRRAMRTGVWPNKRMEVPVFGDFTNIPDYRSAQQLIVETTEQFEKIPARIRERFHNSVDEFVAFVSNPENSEDVVKMGLGTKRAEKTADNAVLAPKKKTKKAATPEADGKKSEDSED